MNPAVISAILHKIMHLERHYRAQLDGSDANCHNFEFTAPSHTTASGKPCHWSPQTIIAFHEITETQWEGQWECRDCGTIFEVYVPLNSEMEG